MATLESIRKRGPLVAVVIGFSLLMFILGDFINKGNSIFSGDSMRIAKINGKSINFQEYEQEVTQGIETAKQNYGLQSITEAQREQIREMVWENLIQKALLEEQYNTLGIDVSSDELFDLIQGKSVDPMVSRERAFANPQTGTFDPSRVVYFYKNMDQDETGKTKEYLLNLEKQVKSNRLVRKYLTLVSKGLYIPKQLVETEFNSRNYLVDFDFVAKYYVDLSDSSITVNKSELEKYYDEHKKEYEQKTSRDIAYVTFDVLASKKDTAYTVDWINKIVGEFKTTEDIKQFISFNSDNTYDPKHFKKGEITNALVDSFLFNNAPGAVYGPYFEDGSYKLAKLIETSSLPDTIKAKHILVAINGKNIPDIDKAKKVADSLKTVIASGIDFALLAKEFSADKASIDSGGNIGWVKEGQQVNGIPISPFDELVGKTMNEVVLVSKEFGVDILVKTSEGARIKKIQAGFLERKIMPSTETYQKIYAEASKFAGDNRTQSKFDAAITKQSLIRKLAPGLTENGTFISGLESPRQLIKWAYKAKKGEVSEVFELGNRYVIGTLLDIKEEGIAPLEQVQDFVRTAVIKEKKAEILLKKVNASMKGDITSLALSLESKLQEAKNISFASNQIQGMGFEPLVLATVVTSEKDKISKALKGENGVYVVNVKIITPSMNTEKLDLTIEKNRQLNDLQTRVYPNPNYGDMGQVLNALKESAEIKDERSKFY